MVLGGVEYWKMNCGSLTSTGEYFVALAIKKHGIDEEEMHMDMSFQTGLFAATLYNSCDHFLRTSKNDWFRDDVYPRRYIFNPRRSAK